MKQHQAIVLEAVLNAMPGVEAVVCEPSEERKYFKDEYVVGAWSKYLPVDVQSEKYGLVKGVQFSYIQKSFH